MSGSLLPSRPDSLLKPRHRIFSIFAYSRFSALLWVFLLSGQKTNASIVQIQFPADLDASTQFTASDGGSLSGNLVRVGAFNVDPVALLNGTATLTSPSDIITALANRFIPFGSFHFSNSFLSPQDPYFSLTASPDADLLDLAGKDVYLLFYDSPLAEAANELALFRTKPTAPRVVFDSAVEFGELTPVFTLRADYVDLLIGYYDQLADVWETGDLNGGVGRIFSPTNETIEAGDVASFFIRANHGANHFAVTNLQVSTNGGMSFSNTTNSWISVATHTGELTLAAPENDTNRYRITLIASNTLTEVSASNTLQLTLLQPTGPDFGTSNNRIVVKAGVAFTTNLPANRAAIFTNVGTLPSWLTFSNQAPGTLVLAGTPPLIATNLVRFRAVDATDTNQTRSRQLSLVAEAPVLELPGVAEDGTVDITVGSGSNTLIPVGATGFRVDEVTIAQGQDSFGAGGIYITNSTNFGFSSSLRPTARTNTNGTRIVLQAVQSNSAGTITVAREFRVRLAAPAPTRLLGTNEFEVDVGRPFETNIQTDASPWAQMEFSGLPSSLEGKTNGAVTGSGNIEDVGGNRNTDRPYEFTVTVKADSSANYLGGGVFTSTVTIRLRNTNLPLFIPATNRILAGVGRPYLSPLNWTNFPFRFGAENLPPGLTIDGATIKGTPTSPGSKTVTVRATNSIYPGSTDTTNWRSGVGNFTIVVDGAPPPRDLAPASPGALPRNTLITGMNYFLLPGGAEAAGVRMAAYGLPPGLTLNKDTGKLEGTTGGPGTYTATVFIANGLGWTKKTVTLTIQ
jgi:hypothetical protein